MSPDFSALRLAEHERLTAAVSDEPPLPPEPVEDYPPDDSPTFPGNGGETPETLDGEADDGNGYAKAVAYEAQRLRIRDDGKALYDRQRELANPAEPFDLGTVAEILARPTTAAYRVDDLIPADGSTLIVSQRKRGKTTLVLNLGRALLIGERFLGRFDVAPVTGRIALLNFEVSAAQLARWADDVGVPADRLILANMRGRRNPLSNPRDRVALAQLLRDANVETLIVDPFGRAYGGTSQNDAGEVGTWLIGLDAFRAEVSASDLILTAHAGWNGERTRGSSALDDWADSIITITGDDETGTRYLRAEGRDVHIDEDELLFDPYTRRLTLTGAGSRKQAAAGRKVTDLLDAIVPILKAAPGLSGVKIADALRESGAPFQRGDEAKALRYGVETGVLAVTPGSRGAKLYALASTYPDLPRPTPAGDVSTYPDPPIGGGGGGVGETPGQGTLETTYPEARCPTHGTPAPAGVGCAECAADAQGIAL